MQALDDLIVKVQGTFGVQQSAIVLICDLAQHIRDNADDIDDLSLELAQRSAQLAAAVAVNAHPLIAMFIESSIASDLSNAGVMAKVTATFVETAVAA